MNSEICSSLDVVRKGLAKQKGFREDREVSGLHGVKSKRKLNADHILFSNIKESVHDE